MKVHLENHKEIQYLRIFLRTKMFHHILFVYTVHMCIAPFLLCIFKT